MARRPTRNKPQPINPPMPPHKLVVVNASGNRQVKQHIRRIQQQPPPSYTPPDLPGAA